MGELIGIAFVIFAVSFGIIGCRIVKFKHGPGSGHVEQNQEFARIHSDLRALKEHVEKVQEYVTDIYIHYYNTERTSKLMNPELNQNVGKEPE